MAGGSKGLRRVLGSIKDSTKVGLASINSDYKNLDIAVVKATNHVECPPKEKHVRIHKNTVIVGLVDMAAIFAATSSSRPRADVAYCIHALARRIAKTHNWTVALKSMMVIHRTLREGDPTFREELLNYARNRGHVLNLSNFKDDSSPNAWDYSAWCRTYALYLEERLECCRVLKYDVEAERSSAHSRTRELDTEDLLDQMPALQQLLHRLMGCQPEGAAISNYVIQAALGLVLKESFKLYRAINDGIINLVDKFFEMNRHDALKALDIYKRASQQAGRLSEFYEMCKGLDLARNFQFPALEQPPRSFLFTMEDYVRDSSRSREDYEDQVPRIRSVQDYDNGSPPVERMPEEFLHPPKSTAKDLMELNEGLQTDRNSFALAVIPQGSTSSGEGGGPETNGDRQPEVRGWEVALVSNANSNGGATTSQLGGGFDKQLLDSLYDDALQKRGPYNFNPGTSSAGSNPFDQQIDPFAASNNYAPPSPIQMAMMQQQAFLLQQQQRLSMTMPSANNPFGNPFAVPITPPPNSPPQPHPSSTQLILPPPPSTPYQHNPFGNPGLL